jgi:hypothetical protein
MPKPANYATNPTGSTLAESLRTPRVHQPVIAWRADPLGPKGWQNAKVLAISSDGVEVQFERDGVKAILASDKVAPR